MRATLIVLLCLAATASARIGETPDECAKRYGRRALDFGEERQVYGPNAAGYMIDITFHKGRAAEVFLFKGKDAVESVPLSARQHGEKKAILDTYYPIPTWRQYIGEGQATWKTTDGKCVAFFPEDRDGAVIATVEYAELRINKRRVGDR